MKNTALRAFIWVTSVAITGPSPLWAGEPLDDTSKSIVTDVRDLVLHPKAEPSPALKYQLIPDQYVMKDGNAAIYYLKAMGFFEQTLAQQRLYDVQRKAREESAAKGIDIGQVEPYSFLELPPSKYPIDRVQEYLALTSFQPRFIEEARRIRDFSMDRRIKDSKNPMGYLLPEIQAMRELSRTQSVRCRLAIAEERIDDAIKIIGQQFALSRHLGQDDFGVCLLVAVAIQQVAINDLYYLIQLEDCPNLFWAVSQLPNPLHNWDRCMAYERHIIDQQFEMLDEITTQRKSIEFMEDFQSRLLNSMKENECFYWDTFDENQPKVTDSKAQMAQDIASSLVPAKEFLIQNKLIEKDAIDSYTDSQVFFLAMKHHFQMDRDEKFKIWFLPSSRPATTLDDTEGKRNADAPAFTQLGNLWLFVQQWQVARQRSRQNILAVQAIEGVRMYAANNGGKLPDSLDALPYPLANDPVSGKPLEYTKSGDQAVIKTSPNNNQRLQLNIRVANAK